jgi:hypothetical protein
MNEMTVPLPLLKGNRQKDIGTVSEYTAECSRMLKITRPKETSQMAVVYRIQAK